MLVLCGNLRFDIHFSKIEPWSFNRANMVFENWICSSLEISSLTHFSSYLKYCWIRIVQWLLFYCTWFRKPPFHFWLWMWVVSYLSITKYILVKYYNWKKHYDINVWQKVRKHFSGVNRFWSINFCDDEAYMLPKSYRALLSICQFFSSS